MKRLVTMAVAVLLALPLVAEEPKAKEETKKQTAAKTEAPKPSVRPLTDTSTQPNPADSPLVAAAKRANAKRQKTPSKVITNETVASSKGGHITTTTEQREIRMPAPLEPLPPTLDMIHAQKLADEKKKAAEDAAAKAKAAEDERLRRGRAAARAEAGEELPPDAPVDDAEREALPDKPPSR